MQSKSECKNEKKVSKTRSPRQAKVSKYGSRFMDMLAWLFKQAGIVTAGLFILFAIVFVVGGIDNYAIASIYYSFWSFGIFYLFRFYCKFISNCLREIEVDFINFD